MSRSGSFLLISARARSRRFKDFSSGGLAITSRRDLFPSFFFIRVGFFFLARVQRRPRGNRRLQGAMQMRAARTSPSCEKSLAAFPKRPATIFLCHFRQAVSPPSRDNDDDETVIGDQQRHVRNVSRDIDLLRGRVADSISSARSEFIFALSFFFLFLVIALTGGEDGSAFP